MKRNDTTTVQSPGRRNLVAKHARTFNKHAVHENRRNRIHRHRKHRLLAAD